MGCIVCATRGGEGSRAVQLAAIERAKQSGKDLVFLFVGVGTGRQEALGPPQDPLGEHDQGPPGGRVGRAQSRASEGLCLDHSDRLHRPFSSQNPRSDHLIHVLPSVAPGDRCRACLHL